MNIPQHHRVDDRGRGASLVVILVATCFVIIVGAACAVIFGSPRAVDFVSFWGAAQMLGENPYDVAAHALVESAVVPLQGILPFVHPPPFLLFIAPFGLLGFPVAFVLWTLVTGGLFLLATRRVDTLAHPSVIATGLVGQTGFLTAAIFIGGFRVLASRPWLAGAILGCLIIKPQLGALLPVALLAGRQWKTIGGAAGSSLTLVLASCLIFGPRIFVTFAKATEQFFAYLNEGRWEWNTLASVYAFARYLGANAQLAFVIHGAVAAFGAAACWLSWRTDHPDKVAVLAAATVLIPPYIFGYDCLLLVIPLQAILSRHLGIAAALWCLSMLPIAQFFGLYGGPNTLPLAALFSLLILSPPTLSSRWFRRTPLNV